MLTTVSHYLYPRYVSSVFNSFILLNPRSCILRSVSFMVCVSLILNLKFSMVCPVSYILYPVFHIGPDTWGKWYPVCDEGKRQSPIDLVPETCSEDPTLPALVAKFSRLPQLSLENTGMTWKVGKTFLMLF